MTRWNFARWLFGMVALGGLGGLVVLIPMEGASERLTVAITVFVVGCVGFGYASSEYRRARFADAFVSEGTILAVYEIPGDSETPNVAVFAVEAENDDGGTLHRRVEVQNWPEPDMWVGRRLKFRHRTIEPEFLADAYVSVDERQTMLQEDGS